MTLRDLTIGPEKRRTGAPDVYDFAYKGFDYLPTGHITNFVQATLPQGNVFPRNTKYLVLRIKGEDEVPFVVSKKGLFISYRGKYDGQQPDGQHSFHLFEIDASQVIEKLEILPGSVPPDDVELLGPPF